MHLLRHLIPLLLALSAYAGPGKLLVCGWDELYILDVSGSAPRKIWTWKAADRPELPADMRAKFRTIAECKPADGGERILITASSNGAAVIERSTGKAAFYATVANAHSIETLPAGRVVVAASHSPAGAGDRLVLFDIARPDREVFHTELSWAHGVVWDQGRELLWALGDTELRAYKLANWNTPEPSLAREASWPLPEKGGHDLAAVPGVAMLSLTTGRHCWLFDRERREFVPHPALAARAGVKCIHVNPATGQTVWVLSEGGNWWTDKLRFLDPERTVQLAGERIYKARWLP